MTLGPFPGFETYPTHHCVTGWVKQGSADREEVLWQRLNAAVG